MYLKSLIVSLLFVASISVHSQQTIRFNQAIPASELSEGHNSYVYFDKVGRVWISSLKGLNYFDGRLIRVFQPQTTDTNSVYGTSIQGPFFEDDKGDIWFSTYRKNSISVYRGASGKFNHYFISEEENKNQASSYDVVFLEHKRWLWVIVNDKLLRYDTKSPPQYKNEYLLDLQAARFAVDTFENGNVRRLVACYWDYKRGFEIIDFDRNTKIRQRRTFFSEHEKKDMPLLTISQALIDNDSLIWLISNKGLVALNPDKPNAFKIFSTEPYGKYPRNFALDGAKGLFVTTIKTPLIFFDKKSQVFTPFRIKVKNQDDTFQPMQNGAYEVYIDRSNVLWLSILNEGIYFAPLKKQNFVNPFATIATTSKSIVQILEDSKGQIWAASNSNLHLFNGAKYWTNDYVLTPKSSLTMGPDNRIWSVSSSGLVQYFDDQNNRFQTIFRKNEQQFRDIKACSDNSFLVGSNHDLFMFNNHAEQLKPLGLNKFFTQMIICQNKDVWCSTSDGTVLLYRINAHKEYVKSHEIIDKGIINHFHNSTLAPSVIWVATTKGLLKINTKNLTDTLLTEKDGLPNDIIQAVLEDKKGYLWCSTNRGIICYNPKNKSFRQFTLQNGISSDQYNANAALLSSKGEMWFGSINGLDVFHPDSIQNISQAPQLAISGLKIYDKYWQGDTAINVANHVYLKYFENTLTFELSAMEYTNPLNNKFKVMMEGYDKEWVNLSTQNFVTYLNLPYGDYIFKFTACNSEGIWNENPRILHLIISPPFWKTWWFITLCIVATMTLIGYIIYLRLSKIIDLQEIRIKLYENLHDDLGSRLTAIVMAIDGILLDIKTPKIAESNIEMQSKTLTEIRTVGSHIVGNMHLLVWATNPENDELSNVVQQMRTDKDMLLPKAQLVINMNETLKNLKIDGNKRYQMLSIFDEALTNISKYAEATLVTVALECVNDVFSLTINDNGKGFDIETPKNGNPFSGGNGFRTMRNRAKRINGQLKITSSLGKGTTIVLTFSLRETSFFQRLKRVFFKFSPK